MSISSMTPPSEQRPPPKEEEDQAEEDEEEDDVQDATSQDKRKKKKRKKKKKVTSSSSRVYIPPAFQSNVRVTTSPTLGVGRCAVAARALAPGDLIFEEEPIALVNFSRYAHEYCVFCGKHGPRGRGVLVPATDLVVDGTVMCCAAPACAARRGAAHRLAGKEAWARIAEIAKDEKTDAHLLTMVMLLVCQRHLARQGGGEEHQLQRRWMDVDALMDHWGEQTEEWKECVGKAMMRLIQHLPEDVRGGGGGGGLSVEDAVRLACVVNVNSHGVGTTRSFNQMRGLGLFPLLACLNHSCRPNCAYVFDTVNGGKMGVRALEAIGAGEELFVHYTNLLVSREVRREELRVSKYFDCVCRRCEGEGVREGEADRLMAALCCAACGLEGRVLAPGEEPTAAASEAAAAALLRLAEEEEEGEGVKGKKKKGGGGGGGDWRAGTTPK